MSVGSRRRWWGHPLGLALMLAVTLVALATVPGAQVRPAAFSLTRVESAKHVDFEDEVVWFLVLGSDARPGVEVTEGNTDAIQLVGIDFRAGRAAGIGVPRDSYVNLPGQGFRRINEALALDGPDLAAAAVADLVGITPDYVLVAGFAGFQEMVSAVGGVAVRSRVGFREDRFDLTVRRGVNRFGAADALDFARSRIGLAGGDFERSANQQRLMLGILRQLRGREDEEGFMERGTLAALGGLDTDLAPTELYRLAQAVTEVRPREVTLCVVAGTPAEVSGASVVRPDRAQARRLGDDARDDGRLDDGCR